MERIYARYQRRERFIRAIRERNCARGADKAANKAPVKAIELTH